MSIDEIKQIEKHIKPRRWDKFEGNSSEIFRNIAQTISWRQQNSDSNRSRWPQRVIWSALIENFSKTLEAPSSGELNEAILRRLRTDYSSGLGAQFRGVLATMAAIEGISDCKLVKFAKETSTKAAEEIGSNLDWKSESSKRRLRTGLYSQ